LKEPQQRRLVTASGDNPAVIRADRHRIDLVLVAAQNHGVSRRIFGKLRNDLRDKYVMNALTWDDLYALQLAMLPLYPEAQLRTKAGSLRDAFYGAAPKHLIETYEKTSPPSLGGKNTNYEATLAGVG
jgi:hypothetical protein